MKEERKIVTMVTCVVFLVFVIVPAIVFAESNKPDGNKWDYVPFTNISNTFTEEQYFVFDNTGDPKGFYGSYGLWINVSGGSKPGAFLNLKSDDGERTGLLFYQNDPNREMSNELYRPELSWYLTARDPIHHLMFLNENYESVFILNQDKSTVFKGPISVFTDFDLIPPGGSINGFKLEAQNGNEAASIIIHRLPEGDTGAHVAVWDKSSQGPNEIKAMLHIRGDTPTVQNTRWNVYNDIICS